MHILFLLVLTSRITIDSHNIEDRYAHEIQWCFVWFNSLSYIHNCRGPNRVSAKTEDGGLLSVKKVKTQKWPKFLKMKNEDWRFPPSICEWRLKSEDMACNSRGYQWRLKTEDSLSIPYLSWFWPIFGHFFYFLGHFCLQLFQKFVILLDNWPWCDLVMCVTDCHCFVFKRKIKL